MPGRPISEGGGDDRFPVTTTSLAITTEQVLHVPGLIPRQPGSLFIGDAQQRWTTLPLSITEREPRDDVRAPKLVIAAAQLATFPHEVQLPGPCPISDSMAD